MNRPTAVVYIDGFNLYKRALQASPYKWLNLAQMTEMILSGYSIIKTNYYSALVDSPPHDPQQTQRQLTYWRALRTLSNFEIHQGKFEPENAYRPNIPWEYDENCEPRKTKVRLVKEKGSDVKLASHLIYDASRDLSDFYFVLSADSDQFEPLRIVKEQMKKNVGLILPSAQDNKQLKKLADPLVYNLREGVLFASQFPEELFDADGTITKPKSW